MSDMETAGIVVVGGSLAGLRGAEALRNGGYTGPLTIVGDEPYPPYDRPPLSKHVLAGALDAASTELPRLVRLNARWRLGQTVVALDRIARVIGLADGSAIPFQSLLVATGAQARRWTRAGSELAGVFTIRTRDDAAALRSALASVPARVLIIGGGLIGCETASCCSDLGLPTTLVDSNPAPLSRVLGATVGNVIAGCMMDAGVDFRASTHVDALEGAFGKVVRARLSDGSAIETDLVVVALGAVRETGWLSRAGLLADSGGLTCDSACRALNVEGQPDLNIFAAGDVARWPNAHYGDRLMTVEHWGNAIEQAEHAARNILSDPSDQNAYRHLPAFWSSQFGINIKTVGSAEGAEAAAITQGSLSSRRFLAVYGREGHTVAAVSFDEARWLPSYARRIEIKATFPPVPGAIDQERVDVVDPGFPAPRELAGATSSVRQEAAHA